MLTYSIIFSCCVKVFKNRLVEERKKRLYEIDLKIYLYINGLPWRYYSAKKQEKTFEIFDLMRKKRFPNQFPFSFPIFNFDIFEIGFKSKGHVIYSKSTNKEETIANLS